MDDKYVKLSDVKRKVNYILKRNGSSPQTQRDIKDALNNLPYTLEAEIESTLEAADVQPVKRGQWEEIEDFDGDTHFGCTACGAEFYLEAGTPEDNEYYYCPKCGARMDNER